jgi:CheY-like chemotaxis protein
MGHSAIESASGRQALDLLMEGRRVDLVITDQAMPGMTGLQLASAIRQAWPGLPVVLATGYAELPDGALHDLCRVKKPFDQEALARIIRASQAPAPPSQNVVPLRAMQG